jgi:hypothetical protein
MIPAKSSQRASISANGLGSKESAVKVWNGGMHLFALPYRAESTPS